MFSEWRIIYYNGMKIVTASPMDVADSHHGGAVWVLAAIMNYPHDSVLVRYDAVTVRAAIIDYPHD